MKKDKKLLKLVENLIRLSFDRQGGLIVENVKRYSRSLQLLPPSQAIQALFYYLQGLKREIKRFTLEVESITTLTPSQLQEIVSRVKSRYQISQVKTVLNPQLLGGLKIHVGDQVFDDSLLRRMEQLREVIES